MLASSTSSASENDARLLARIINAEARGESYIGQVAVGAVVLNRVKHPSFPDSIAVVIYQPGAFTAISDGQWNASMYQQPYQAARDALNGWGSCPAARFIITIPLRPPANGFIPAL